MTPDQVYILMFRGVPVRAHTRFEGANEDMAEHSAEIQEEMSVLTIRLVNDD